MPERPAGGSPLVGIGVLVTRPAHQADRLVGLIEQAGGTAIRFPTIEIGPPRHPEQLRDALTRLSDFDLAVFVSPNAVEQTFRRLEAEGHRWPSDITVACVGRASARALERFGIHPLAPERRYDSEALLALPALQQVAGRRVVIFRGDGGRELLAETLAERGATVTYVECYRRVRPAADATPVLRAWRDGKVHVVSVTSTEGLHNLYDMLAEPGRRLLLGTPMIVLSEAQAAECRKLGFVHPARVVTEASDEAILEAIKVWRRSAFPL
ncbi:MAG: uroporphyrinogen-III synthase [Sulfurifustaceae bacterium]